MDESTRKLQRTAEKNPRKTVAASISDEMFEKVTLANNVCTSVFLVTNVSVSSGPEPEPEPASGTEPDPVQAQN